MKNLKIKVKCLLLVVVYFGISVFLSYSTDTYYTFSVGYEKAGLNMIFQNGRPVIGLLYLGYSLSGLPNEFFYYISTFFSLFLLYASIMIMQETLKKYIPFDNERILISFFSIANCFIIEYFMFIEKGCFMLAILFVVLAVSSIEKAFSSGGAMRE